MRYKERDTVYKERDTVYKEKDTVCVKERDTEINEASPLLIVTYSPSTRICSSHCTRVGNIGNYPQQ